MDKNITCSISVLTGSDNQQYIKRNCATKLQICGKAPLTRVCQMQNQLVDEDLNGSDIMINHINNNEREWCTIGNVIHYRRGNIHTIQT